MQMTTRIDAMVASAFNVLAAANPEMRKEFPGGLHPEMAAELASAKRADLLSAYATHYDSLSKKEQRDMLYSSADVKAALATA